MRLMGAKFQSLGGLKLKKVEEVLVGEIAHRAVSKSSGVIYLWG